MTSSFPTKILIVEDERIIAKVLQKQLTEMSYQVIGTATSGEEAVQLAASQRPEVILMDIHLGSDGIDGVEAAELIRRQSDVPIVYLTAHSDPATLARAKITGPHGYVLKPYENQNLQIAIDFAIYKSKMDRQLRQNEQWLATTLGSIGDGVIATDAEGKVRFLNAEAEQLTGWSQAEAKGADVREVFRIVHEQTRQPVTNPAIEALAKGECVNLPVNTLLIARDGTERPIDDSAAPVKELNGAVSGSVLVFRDITEKSICVKRRRWKRSGD
jgi:two-component system, cell cycle sensor histidine kinase and response regulator CckA